MESTLLIGDHVLVDKLVYAPQDGLAQPHALPNRDVRRGDIIVFRYPLDIKEDYVKRATGHTDADVRDVQDTERGLAQRLGDGELVHLFIIALLQIDDLALGMSSWLIRIIGKQLVVALASAVRPLRKPVEPRR